MNELGYTLHAGIQMVRWNCGCSRRMGRCMCVCKKLRWYSWASIHNHECPAGEMWYARNWGDNSPCPQANYLTPWEIIKLEEWLQTAMTTAVCCVGGPIICLHSSFTVHCTWIKLVIPTHNWAAQLTFPNHLQPYEVTTIGVWNISKYTSPIHARQLPNGISHPLTDPNSLSSPQMNKAIH